MIITFNEFNKYPELKGIFVGGCVERGEGSSFRAMAHTHKEGDLENWICIRSLKRVYMADGIRPSMVVLHELAHVLVEKTHWHDSAWMLKLNEIGGHIDKQYKRTKNYRNYIKAKKK